MQYVFGDETGVLSDPVRPRVSWQRDERGAADFAAVWPVDGGAVMAAADYSITATLLVASMLLNELNR